MLRTMIGKEKDVRVGQTEERAVDLHNYDYKNNPCIKNNIHLIIFQNDIDNLELYGLSLLPNGANNAFVSTYRRLLRKQLPSPFGLSISLLCDTISCHEYDLH